ncbi:hypothetical protein CH278_25640 [Rhodococcus sp. 05-2254-5]|nr:hypothetical protein CH278_25640 [Rhodococcus sp. 05-2254-5]OZE58288.1 hypothetical protein CH269_10800 [Rhodococcus sp. 05-2254-1]
MSENIAYSESLIWATRGQTWGFRFLLDAGQSDPLAAYERAFGNLSDSPNVWHRQNGEVALRISDPLERRDSAGRVIPHEFVLLGDLAATVDSVEDGLRMVWPLVSERYAVVWATPNPNPSSD